MSNGPQNVTDPILVNPPPEGLLNNANTGLRKPESPKSAGESPGNSAWKKGTAGPSSWGDCWEQCWEAAFLGKQRSGTAPSNAPAVHLFLALFINRYATVAKRPAS